MDENSTRAKTPGPWPRWQGQASGDHLAPAYTGTVIREDGTRERAVFGRAPAWCRRDELIEVPGRFALGQIGVLEWEPGDVLTRDGDEASMWTAWFCEDGWQRGEPSGYWLYEPTASIGELAALLTRYTHRASLRLEQHAFRLHGQWYPAFAIYRSRHPHDR